MNTATHAQRGTRMLFLDDSGHPAPNHASQAVVIGGTAIASTSVRALSRRIAGAKVRHFPNRRHPAKWEIRATDTIRPNAWKRQRNRSLVSSVASYVPPRRLPLHPTVYYADSTTSQAIQTADLISGTRRRALEGDASMQTLDNDFAGLHPAALAGLRTHTKRHWTNRIIVF